MLYISSTFLFRKRGGSVDNILDDLGDVSLGSARHGISHPGGGMTKESKQKSVSTKNLSLSIQPMVVAHSDSSGGETSNSESRRTKKATAKAERITQV